MLREIIKDILTGFKNGVSFGWFVALGFFLFSILAKILAARLRENTRSWSKEKRDKYNAFGEDHGCLIVFIVFALTIAISIYFS